MSQLQLESVRIAYGATEVVRDLSLSLERGHIGCLLGPSGCGKTTILRAIAGFERLTSGLIAIHGESVSTPHQHRAPEQRRVGMVFQDFALFPHLSVAYNVSFGLRSGTRAERRARADEMLAVVGLSEHADKFPHQLSGGQQQRIALARALASRPRVLLLDESLSALDMKLRKDMQIELKRLQAETGITFIFVTHDQEEALTMSDRIAVMSKGRILQVGTPNEIYERPLNRTVADFIGETNFLEADPFAGGARLADGQVLSLAGMPESGRITLAIRPERISLTDSGNLAGEVEEVVYIGTDTLYLLKVAGQSGFRVRQQNRAGSGQPLPRGAQVRLDVPAAAIRVLGE